MTISGKNNWLEGFTAFWDSIADDTIVNENIDLLIVPQYGRNSYYSG